MHLYQLCLNTGFMLYMKIVGLNFLSFVIPL